MQGAVRFKQPKGVGVVVGAVVVVVVVVVVVGACVLVVNVEVAGVVNGEVVGNAVVVVWPLHPSPQHTSAENGPLMGVTTEMVPLTRRTPETTATLMMETSGGATADGRDCKSPHWPLTVWLFHSPRKKMVV